MTATPLATAAPTWPATVGPAEERIVRVFARFVGAGGLLFVVLLTPGAVSLAGLTPAWWTPLALTAVLAPLAALWPAAHAVDLRWIRRCADLAAAGYLLAAASWLALAVGHVPSNRDIWLGSLPALVGMAVALTRRPAAALGYVAAAAAGAELVRYVTREGRDHVVLPVEIVSLTVFCALFTVATLAAVHTGRNLDRAVASSVRQAADVAARDARDVERNRLHALIRDRITTTLLGLSRRGNTDDLSAQARLALTELDRLRVSDVGDENLDGPAAIALIRAALGSVDGHVPVEIDVRGDPPDVPRAAARALAAAAAEALRNSLRHADTPDRRADRLVAVDADPDELRVVVADNGRGFDPDRVVGGHLGVRTDIHERMRTADGCTATIASAPGRGTRVVLLWSRRA